MAWVSHGGKGILCLETRVKFYVTDVQGVEGAEARELIGGQTEKELISNVKTPIILPELIRTDNNQCLDFYLISLPFLPISCKH